MRKPSLFLSVLLAVASVPLAGCGTLGRLDAADGPVRSVGSYERVVVGEFLANDGRPAKDAAAAAARAAAIEAGRREFAARIAAALRGTGAFAEVAEEPLPGPALRLHGTIDQWEPGNIAARSILGFAGKSEFDATVIVADLETGAELARIVIDRNSWPLPVGASTNLVQSVEFLMDQAASRVAAELAKARGVEVAPPASR